MVVDVGETETPDPLSPPGCQLYVDAPVAVIEDAEPGHILAGLALTFNTGNVLTVMVLVEIFVQPVVVLVPITA